MAAGLESLYLPSVLAADAKSWRAWPRQRAEKAASEEAVATAAEARAAAALDLRSEAGVASSQV